MPILLLLVFPFVEIYLAIQVGDEIGYFNAIVLLCGAALVGFGLLNITGRTFLIELQARAMRGEALGKVIMSQALRFCAGLLFIIPGFVSDAIALIALVGSLLPGLFAPLVSRNMKKWNSKFVVFNQQPGPQPGSWSEPTGPSPFRQNVRDVTPENTDPKVIDISPKKP